MNKININNMETPDKVSKELYSISAELSIAICDPMSLTLDDRIEWLIELKKDYLKRFGKEFNYISKFISLMNNSNDDNSNDSDSSDDDNSIEINKYYNKDEDDDDNIVFVKFDKEKERNKDKEGFWRWIENESSSQSDDNDNDNVDDNIEIRSNDSDNFDYNNFDYDNYDQWILSLNNNDNSNQLSSFM
mgnify:FL=1